MAKQKPGVSKDGKKPVLASKPDKTKRTNPRLRSGY